MKGKTEIILTDVNTNKVEIIKENNLVTNAVYKALNENIEGMFYNIDGESVRNWDEDMFPIAGNILGGVILFEDTIDENVNTLFAPSVNKCVGHANMEANSTDIATRGSINLNESMKLDNGYKYVWDFATSQGNGMISSICLTHKYGALAYTGNLNSKSYSVIGMKTVMDNPSYESKSIHIDAVEINFEENLMYSISIDEDDNVIIYKVKKYLTKMGLNGELNNMEDEILEKTTLNPTTFIRGSYNYCDFFNGENGYWYGFICDYNSVGNASIKWIKINKNDYTFTEGTWSLNNVTVREIGYRSGYNTSSPSRRINCVMKDGYLYIPNYTKNGVYKINADNPADIKLIELGFYIGSHDENDADTNMYRFMDLVVGTNYMILPDDSVIQTVNVMPLTNTSTPLFQNELYALTFGISSSTYQKNYMYKKLWLITPYLGTINNLSSSVEKTADKTMKIIYTLTES